MARDVQEAALVERVGQWLHDAEIEAATKKHRDPAILVPVGFGQPDEWAIS